MEANGKGKDEQFRPDTARTFLANSAETARQG